jgi:methylaspartate mutase epsilon subunit
VGGYNLEKEELNMAEVIVGKWKEQDFEKERKSVLASWPTGSQVNFQEGVEYQRHLPETKRATLKFAKAKEDGITLIQPRAGIAPLDAFIDMLQVIQNEGGADILPVTVDSETRHQQYTKAEEGIKLSEKTGRSALNGFPIVNYGVTGGRQLVEAVNLPLELRPAAPDMRLPAEIAYASGFSASLGGPIVHCLQHHKNAEPEKAIRDHQYVHRLAGKYEERGIPLLLEMAGYMSGILVPPGESVAIMTIESLIAAEQGVKNLVVGYQHSGHLFQDIAALRATYRVASAYLDAFGYKEVNLYWDLHSWVGRFPEDASMSYGIICQAAVTAALGKAQMIMSKSIDQGCHLPAKDANAAAVRATKQIFGMMSHQELVLSEEWQEERDAIEREARAIVNKVMELGEGSVARGAARAIRVGVIDMPFAPNSHNAGKVMPIRDQSGAIRILDPGNLPLSKEMLRYHEHKLESRKKSAGGELTSEMVVQDVIALSKGALRGNP